MQFITHPQARAARAILRWSVARAAQESGLTGNTVNRYEQGRKARMETPYRLRAAYEKSGIRFPDGNTIAFDPSFNAVSEDTETSD